jgi:PAS domain S-box-containing protein
MKIKTQLYLSSIITIALIGVLFVALLYTTNKIETACGKAVSAHKIEFAVFQLNALTHEYLMYHEERMIEQWRSVYASLAPMLGESELNASVRQNYLALDGLFSQITINYAKKQTPLQEYVPQKEVDSDAALEERLATQLLIKSQGIFGAVAKLADDKSAEAVAANVLSAKVGLVGLIILGIFSILAALIIVRVIIRSLDALRKGVEIFGEGNLEHKINIQTENEIGQVARVFNVMAAQLKASYAGLEEKVKERTKQLAVAEADARRERDQTEIYLQGIGDAVVAIDRNWKITLWNASASKLSGWEKDEVMGKPFRDFIKLIRENDRSENISFIEDAMVTGKKELLTGRTLLIRKNNEEVMVGDSAAPLFNEKGEVSGIIIIMRDASKEKEAAMLHSDFAYAAHQLRTPVTKASWLMETILGEDDAQKIKERTKEAYESLSSVRKLSEELIIVSEIDQGMVIPGGSTVKLTDILDDLIKEVGKKAKDREMIIVAPAISVSSSIDIDPKLLKKILVEVLDNARERVRSR